MAEIKPMALIESMSKKVCMHSDVYFRTNRQTGKVTTEKAKLLAEYKAQHKVGSLFGYAMKKLNANYDPNGDLIVTPGE